MAPRKSAPKTLVEAVQLIFDALEPFDEAARVRILASVTSLLGTGLAGSGSHISVIGQSAASTAPVSVGSSERPPSPAEMVQQKNPVTNSQRVAVFAHYREKIEGLSRFAKADLKPYFAKARLPVPRNFDRDYQEAVKQGWIYDHGADSYLTSKGLEAVEAGFAGKARPRGSSVSKSRKRAKSAKKTSKE